MSLRRAGCSLSRLSAKRLVKYVWMALMTLGTAVSSRRLAYKCSSISTSGSTARVGASIVVHKWQPCSAHTQSAFSMLATVLFKAKFNTWLEVMTGAWLALRMLELRSPDEAHALTLRQLPHPALRLHQHILARLWPHGEQRACVGQKPHISTAAVVLVEKQRKASLSLIGDFCSSHSRLLESRKKDPSARLIEKDHSFEPRWV
jgi:hypothetical protein